MSVFLDDGDVVLHLGDCVEVMAAMPAESVDAIVCDPPYAFPGGFMGKSWDNLDGREDIALGYYLAGLTDGEGSFRVQRHERGSHSCAFSIHMRRDERGLLERVRRFVGHGTITDSTNGTTPMVRWAVQDKEGCAAIVGLFRRFPLRAKKAQDFELWASAVEEWLGRPRGNRWSGPADQTRAEGLKALIEGVRGYREIPWSGHRFQDWTRVWAEQAMRVAKPGAHILVFGSTRTWHRMTAGLEDAGFEIRDTIMFLHGSGFPKSLDVSKAIDKAAGAEREVVGVRKRDGGPSGMTAANGWNPGPMADDDATVTITAPATPEAAKWQGWGTALKPAWEPIVVARKPLGGAVAANVLRHGTGALNIDGCRIGTDDTRRENRAEMGYHGGNLAEQYATGSPAGRFPANVVLDEAAAERLDAEVGERTSGYFAGRRAGMGYHGANGDECAGTYGDTGGPSRFYYTAKASTAERDGATHPTVKPLALMRWCVRLVTTPGGVVLDCFAGSGTTLLAARDEGFRAIGIEREEEYARMIVERYRRRFDPAAAEWSGTGDDGVLSLFGDAA